MNREIKFRGKDFQKGEWRYGTYYFGVLYPTSFQGHYIGDWQVDPETIGEYTGLKDKNGKEIYEGDILEKSNGLPMTGSPPRYKIVGSVKKVIFHEGAFRLTTSLTSKKYHLMSQYIRYYGFEVIGNIYENPELLIPNH